MSIKYSGAKQVENQQITHVYVYSQAGWCCCCRAITSSGRTIDMKHMSRIKAPVTTTSTNYSVTRTHSPDCCADDTFSEPIIYALQNMSRGWGAAATAAVPSLRNSNTTSRISPLILKRVTALKRSLGGGGMQRKRKDPIKHDVQSCDNYLP